LTHAGMSYCTQCGTPNVDGAKFCHFCGRTVTRDAATLGPPTAPSTFVIVANILLLLVIQAALLFVVPVFAAMFADFGSRLPLATQILVDASNFWKHWWWLCSPPLGVLIGVGVTCPPKWLNLSLCLRMAALLQGLLLMAMFIAMALPVVQLGQVASRM